MPNLNELKESIEHFKDFEPLPLNNFDKMHLNKLLCTAQFVLDGKLVEKQEILNIVLDDVPHQYQKRLLEVLNGKV